MNPSVYTRPNKPRLMYTHKRSDPVEMPVIPEVKPVFVDRSTECHVTPSEVAVRMAEYLDPIQGERILEPSAGTGALIRALPGHDFDAIELNLSLIDVLRSICTPIQADFLEWSINAPRYSRIIMNPPFKKIKQHINAAIRLLEPEGVLIALAPITYQNDDAYTLEELSTDTFATAKVCTKIIEITK